MASRHAELALKLLRSGGSESGSRERSSQQSTPTYRQRPDSSLQRRQIELERLRVQDPAIYDLPEVQHELLEVLGKRLALKEIDSNGEPVRPKTPNPDHGGE
jgi:hypothetical protein